MFNFSNFFIEKIDFCARKIEIFENSIHFLILCLVWINKTSLPSGGPSPPPRTPCGGRVIAFQWPGRSPPPRKNPGDASDCISLISLKCHEKTKWDLKYSCRLTQVACILLQAMRLAPCNSPNGLPCFYNSRAENLILVFCFVARLCRTSFISNIGVLRSNGTFSNFRLPVRRKLFKYVEKSIKIILMHCLGRLHRCRIIASSGGLIVIIAPNSDHILPVFASD